ncbi:DNA mismatch repair endonuclease MutL [Oceanivirga miroungae]|uniref:DNA mismatch repair protein MutL n=1 Tax=Oceanivirga miroungae TaxID=1130046 RepID=A0A6I8MDX5_9FUSO|nr:DNA mismatch repair endonuclease MutL [Oceanivirga miroungae]VWL85644.1 DNA mismatch repair protein MutL [Oceanivirga miroungae]
MGLIHILDENISNIIAAGEVVENYASLIKELYENSLDAKAKNILIEISDKLNYIKITDDGTGMQKDDIYLSVERHATSKISKKDDIFNLSSFGFRGEALASIAAVSKMNISSKTNDMKIGHMVTIYGGNIIADKSVAMKTGTVIEIRNLFYNTPARKKFLNKESTEIMNIKDIVLKLALSAVEVSTNLVIDGKSVIKTSGRGIDNTVYEVFGKGIFKNLKKFKYGYLGNSEIFRASKNYIFTYVNNRYTKSNLIERAVIDAYYMKLMKHKYPFAIIFYDINPSEVDVNVHPSKKIVKFSDEKIVYGQIKKEIEDFFRLDDRKDYTNETISETNKKEEVDKIDSFSYSPKGYIQSIFSVSENSKDIYDIIGQAFDTYVLVKKEDSIDFYDQHAMHERIKYEELKERYANQILGAKQLLIPEVIELDEITKDVIFSNIDIFNEFKFDIELISEKEIVVRQVPDFELRVSIKSVIEKMVESLKTSDSVVDIRENVIISIACRSSIMAGQKLDANQMQKLVSKLHEINKYNCPHGRPVIAKVSKEMLDKMHKRIL